MSRRHGALWMLVLPIALLIAGCGDDEGPSDPGGADPVSFDTDVRPVFQQNCSQCHIAGVDLGNLRLVGPDAYDQLFEVVSSGYAPRLRVVPGEPESSVLYLKISGSTLGGRMPPAGALPSEPIETVRRWIAEGARDN